MTNLRTMHLGLWLACTAVCFSAEFYTGQAARLLIGQSTFTALSPGTPGEEDVTTPTASILGGVGGLAIANNTLFLADSNRVAAAPLNHRVLLFRNVDQLVMPVNAVVPQTGRCPICRGTADTVLGQSDFNKNDLVLTPAQNSLRNPTGVASDGTRLVVADTDNNRVLVWNSIPTNNQQQADIVLGQQNFTSNSAPRGASGQLMRGPQGVWIQGSRLFVADSGNNRVLIWNSFPTQNFQSADVVLGQPDFNTVVEIDLTQTAIEPRNNNLLNPVSVTSDGTRLFVADLGQNRVLMWDSIPTQNQQAADLVLGQRTFLTAQANNSRDLCESSGLDDEGTAIFPVRCAATLNFPRYALSDGTRLFIADGGNDRVLVYERIPIINGQTANVVLGQADGESNRSSESSYPLYTASSDLLRTPMSLAWDGTNLFVSDTFNRRILVFSTHDQPLPFSAVRNAASRDVFATGYVVFTGSIVEGDAVTITFGEGDTAKGYTYKFIKDDTFANILTQFAQMINNDPESPVTASLIADLGQLLFTARTGGVDGNSIAFAATKNPETSAIVLTTSGATLAGGQNAAEIAPGTIVTVLGDNLANTTAVADPEAEQLPGELAGVRVYIDGMEAPLIMVSPTEIRAQLPWEVKDATSSNAYVRIERPDGTAVTTSPVAVPVIPYNPGVFAVDGSDPRVGVITHYSDRATGTVSVDGAAVKDNVATVLIEDREYSYTVQEGDSLESIRNGLILAINSGEIKVEAYPATVFTRIRLRATQPGEEGNGIVYSVKVSEGAQVILTPTTPALCCANEQGSLVTAENPALPGETIVLTATGLGVLRDETDQGFVETGKPYAGSPINQPNEFVSSLAGGKTANVLYSALKPGFIGLYELHLELNSDLPTNQFTQITIAQGQYVSNVVTFALRNPNDTTEEP